jgi:hypothetical protein
MSFRAIGSIEPSTSFYAGGGDNQALQETDPRKPVVNRQKPEGSAVVQRSCAALLAKRAVASMTLELRDRGSSKSFLSLSPLSGLVAADRTVRMACSTSF